MINDEKYNRTIILHCPTCGGTDFSFDKQAVADGAAKIECPSCGLITTKDELIRANGENVEAQLDEVKEEIMSDLKKSLTSAFKNNKFIKIK